MDWFAAFDFRFLNELLSDSGKASLAEKMIIVGIVWVLMGRKVASHFKTLEVGMRDGFEQLTHSVNEVRGALTQVELNHSTQLTEIRDRVTVLEQQSPPSGKS